MILAERAARIAAEAARFHDAALEGHSDRAREVLMPGMREDNAAAGSLPRDAARFCRAEPAGDDPVREVRPASAAQPPE